MIDIFDQKTQKLSLKLVEENYFELIEDLREDCKEGLNEMVLSEEFQSQLSSIILSNGLDTYSSYHFYWGSLIEQIILLIQIHDDISDEGHESNKRQGEELNGPEEELFHFWENSEYCEIFVELAEKGGSLAMVSRELIPLLENQIISFYYLHLSDEEIPYTILYRAIPELGDSNHMIYLGKHKKVAYIKNEIDTFPILPISSITETELTVDLDDESFIFPLDEIKPQETLIIPGSVGTRESYPVIEKEITLALDIIKEFVPKCYSTFKNYTSTIVLIDEPGIVSYSMQNLPGVSNINTCERDFVDLIDDLLHENGHHYLNSYLNTSDLIIEDDDKIYYSPWREALRPIRGIYHATFTFFWAMYLFAKLSEKNDSKLYKFPDKEIAKINYRFLEEYEMLLYCEKSLSHAFNVGKITENGNNLILGIFNFMKQFNKLAIRIETQLNADHKNELENLKIILKEKSEHYILN